MAEILIWNSIAKRRRSISDTFYDNGLATLKGYLEEKGHRVDVVDWAQADFFRSLSPMFVAKIVRALYSFLLSPKGFKIIKKLVGLLAFALQDFLSSNQETRLTAYLEQLAQQIKADDVRMVGIKIWYGEAFANAKKLVDLIKKISPETITIAGGYHTTLYEEYLLENSNFDLGVVCEGEYALLKILEIADKNSRLWEKDTVLSEIVKLAKDGEIENLLYRDGNKVLKTSRRQVKLYSSKTVPKYDISDDKVRIHVMVESLGCDWGKCNFCVHSHFYPGYSLREPGEVIKEIKAMLSSGIGIFRFAGSDTPPSFGAKIAQNIIDNKLKIIFGMGSRAIKGARNSYDSLVSSYTKLIEAGLRAVFMGGESGNDFINQEVMNKGVSFEDIVFTINALGEAERKTGKKVFLSLAFIYPPPLLGKVTLNEVFDDNLRLLRETMPDSVMITPPGPFLHTRWFGEKEHFGFDLDEKIITQAMEYEYVLYKPPEFWPKLGISLDNKPFKDILVECSRFRKAVEEDLKIPTDISDEHFLMFYSAGIRDKKAILKAKRDTMLDIISCDYAETDLISQRVNGYSKTLAGQTFAKE